MAVIAIPLADPATTGRPNRANTEEPGTDFKRL